MKEGTSGSLFRCMRESIFVCWELGWEYEDYVSMESQNKTKPVKKEDYDFACSLMDKDCERQNNLVFNQI